MKSNLVRAALACVVLAVSATAAFAINGEPIVGIPVGLEHDPGGIVAKGVTDDKGRVDFGNLAPGKYRIVLDGKGLAAALKKIDPKGLPHTIVVSFGLPDQKPIATSSQPYNAESASLIIRVDTGNMGGDLAKTTPHHYHGIVSLVK